MFLYSNLSVINLNYKDGILLTSEKYTKAAELASRKKYTQEIETGFDHNRVPYSIKKRYMYEYNKDGKIINGSVVIKNEKTQQSYVLY